MARAEEPRSTVEWETPPPTGKNRYNWVVIADQLRAQPLEWGKVFDRDKISVVNAIRQGSVKPLRPDLGFEVRTANNTRAPGRMCSLYIRYNPERDTTRKQKKRRK